MPHRARLAATTLGLALAAVAPAAAIEVPQTRQEFVDAVAAGARATAVETIRVDQPLPAVYAVLEEKANACLDVEVQRTGYVGYVGDAGQPRARTTRTGTRRRGGAL